MRQSCRPSVGCTAFSIARSPTTRCVRQVKPAAGTSAHRPLRDGEPHAASRPRVLGRKRVLRDAQAGVPSTEWPRAQLAFKDSMVRGILQFTPGIAFRYVLHRCESRDIRCRESCGLYSIATRGAASEPAASPSYAQCSLTPSAPWVLLPREPFLRFSRTFGRATNGAPPGGQDYGCAVCFGQGHDNDPSAGSPTETLLRLLLPLNDKVQWTSRDVGGGEPPPSPRSEHFTGPFNR